MNRLVERVRRAILDGRWVIGDHAANQLDRRDIPEWAAVDGSIQADWKHALARHGSRPNASVIVRILLPDGVEAMAVWSWLPAARRTKLVSVFFRD